MPETPFAFNISFTCLPGSFENRQISALSLHEWGRGLDKEHKNTLRATENRENL